MTTEQMPRDYRKRVGAVLDVLIAHTQMLAGPNARRKPEPAVLQHLIDVAPHIYNWIISGSQRLGYSLGYCKGPMLTEQELKSIERMAARLSAMSAKEGGQRSTP